MNAMEKVAPANVLLDRDLQNFLRICPPFLLLCLHSKTLFFIYGSVSHVQEEEEEKNEMPKTTTMKKNIIFARNIILSVNKNKGQMTRPFMTSQRIICHITKLEERAR